MLSQQIRDAIKGLWSASRGAQIVKIRAFVAGSGDMRRVPAIVSEMFTDRRLALPAVSVIQVGTLPLDGAQVVLESIAVDKKVVNPNGIAFISGQAAKVADAVDPLKKALGDLEPRAITCFLAGLEKVSDVRTQIGSAFPRAAVNYLQFRRDTLGDFIECEAIAAPAKPASKSVEFRNSMEGRYSDVAVVPPGKIIISGSQLAFGSREEDLRLAFDRLEKALGSVGGKLSDAIITRMYPLTSATADTARKIRFEFYDAKRPPASTLLVFEGLPSMDASFGIEVISFAR